MRTRLLFSIVAIAALTVSCAQSDVGITTSVKAQLAEDDLVKARRIDVDTVDRVVTLSGEVRSADEKARALKLTRNTDGVVNVVDQLAVVSETAPTTGVGGVPRETGSGVPITDAGITAGVKAGLLADPDTSGMRIDVDTKDGVVTLKGKVETREERAEALDIARKVEGVKDVTDRLTVERRK